MAKAKPAGEGKIGLILALTFFVITSIALGVFAYQFNSEVEGAKNEAKKAKDDEQKVKDALLATQKEASLYKAFIGVELTPEEKAILTGVPGTDPLRAKHQALMANVETRLKAVATAEKLDFDPTNFIKWDWPATGTLPDSPRSGTNVQPARSTTLPQEALRLVAAAERIRLQASDSKKAAEASALAYNTAKNEYENAKKILETARTDTVAEKEKVVKALDAAKKAAAEAFRTESDDFRDKQRKTELARNQAINEKDAAERELADKKEQLAFQKKKDEAKAVSLPYDLPKGKIVSRRGNAVEINLGRADKLQAGVTFSIQPIDYQDKGEQSRIRQLFDPKGRPLKDREGNPIRSFQPKGSIVVTEVLGPNLSKALVTGEYDPNREPILDGDLLYNAAWVRGVSDHVVLVGIFDKDGNGTDDIRQVAAELKKAGVQVDAYWDLATGKWAGDGVPTERTVYAIRGEYPIVLPGGLGEGLTKEKSALRSSLNTALGEAEKVGAKVIGYREYFPRVGYKVAMGVPDDTINQAAAKYLQAAPPPAAPPADVPK